MTLDTKSAHVLWIRSGVNRLFMRSWVKQIFVSSFLSDVFFTDYLEECQKKFSHIKFLFSSYNLFKNLKSHVSWAYKTMWRDRDTGLWRHSNDNLPVIKQAEEWVLNAPIQRSPSMLPKKKNDGGWDAIWLCPVKQYMHVLHCILDTGLYLLCYHF